MTILEENLKRKKELLDQIEKAYFSKNSDTRSITNNSVKKIATLENLVRFYQNSIHTFALESHFHYAMDIKTDATHRFVTDEQLSYINKIGETATATDDQIRALF